VGIDCSGIISPAIFDGQVKIGIACQDIRSNETKFLARLRNPEDAGVTTKRWSFDPAVMHWTDDQLVKAVPCDLLIIDELGPLESEQDLGWRSGIHALESNLYHTALVIIRPSLLEIATHRFKPVQIIKISVGDDPQSIATMILRSFLK
jgi:hypothetical protein